MLKVDLAEISSGQEGQLPQTKAEFAANLLRRMLQAGKLRPGARINVDELARTLGISTTPVREAVRQLQAEGLLTHNPHRTIQVASIAPADLKDIYRIRAALEGLAAELAAEQLTRKELAQLRRLHERMAAAVQDGEPSRLRPLNDEFHLTINHGARSPRLSRLILSVWRGSPVDTFVAILDRGRLSLQQHQAILDALASGSPAQAGAAMRAHIEASLALLLSHVDAQHEKQLAAPNSKSR